MINYCNDGCLTANDGLLRKMMYDLRSNDAFADGKHFGRALPLPILNLSRKAASDIFLPTAKYIIFVKQKHHFRLWRIYHIFPLEKYIITII